jgi:hypothetical protein
MRIQRKEFEITNQDSWLDVHNFVDSVGKDNLVSITEFSAATVTIGSCRPGYHYAAVWYWESQQKPPKTAASSEDKFVDLQEAAAMLLISRNELHELRAAGRIFGYREGSSWKFKLSEVERVIRERR